MVSRSALRYEHVEASEPPQLDDVMVERVRRIIHEYPSFGYRRVWAILRHREGVVANKKAIYRIMKAKKWLVHQRKSTPRPRVQGRRSWTKKSNQRWAMDVTHVSCGYDGWAHLTAIIDCHDREIVGYEFALRGRAKEAERAVEAACLRRFGTLRPKGKTPVLRSDNGLIFQARRFRKACKFYRLSQEFITPYTPQQNGMIERFFRSLKEECVWLHRFNSFNEAKTSIDAWIRWYNEERPHQSLNYMSPRTYRAQISTMVA